MDTWTTLLVLSLFIGSNIALKDKVSPLVGARFEDLADDEVVDQLVIDLAKRRFLESQEMKGYLKSLHADMLGEEDSVKALSQLRSKKKHGYASTSPPPPQQDEGSILDRGLKYLRGLLGDDTQSPKDGDSQPITTPSPEDESIMEDIEKYLEGVAESKNGTLEKILRYIVSYVHRNVHFWLFTRNQEGYEDLWMGKGANITKSDFKANRKTIILVHGWVNSGDNHFAINMVKAFEKFGDYNIISVDWSELSYSFYSLSRLSVNFVGPYVAQMVDFLSKHHDLKVSELHILGHSLGAHIAGIAGLFVKSGKVARITGFDPAKPLFGDDEKYRLDSTDAKFVDVIHSSFLGMSEALGHADFYPNGGGPSQPGCGIDVLVCPHRRSYQYYIESMDHNDFLAYKCSSWEAFTAGNCTSRYTHMGIRAPTRRRGKFYLRTAGESPYALGVSTLEPLDNKGPVQHSQTPRIN